mmetsp:Transcript_32085/g.59266  ORF Transcript_32085/g.59266 Transcript_32085/m.59266 type:complete len:477 (+) Transcript_32085:100-1530(+)
MIVCQLIGAYRLAKSTKWGTIHTDGTGRRQTAIINLIISILEEGDPTYLPILLSASILPEDETAVVQHDAIISFLKEKKEWLQKWKDALEQDFPGEEHDINPDGLDLSKLGYGGNVMTDGCNGARSVNRKLVHTIKKYARERAKRNSSASVGVIIVDAIDAAASVASEVEDSPNPAEEDGEECPNPADDEEDAILSMDYEHYSESDDDDDGDDDGVSLDVAPAELLTNSESEPHVFESYCHHHIRNVWWGALIKHLNTFLKTALAGSLDNVDSQLRVSPNMKSILRLLDKCFSLPANYPKGNVIEFKHWLEKFHKDVPLFPVQRSTGARNDMIIEGSAAFYINGWLYKAFLDEHLSTIDPDNILHENLWMCLTSVELTAQARLLSIIHYAINLPMRWLSGNTHHLASYDWSVLSMSRAIDCVKRALIQIEEDGSKLLDEDFMMNIFSDLNLQPLDDFMAEMFLSEAAVALNIQSTK